MRFSTVLALLLPAGAAVAQSVWNVTVGNNGSLTFDPDNLTGVPTGDMIQFFLYVHSYRTPRPLPRFSHCFISPAPPITTP